MDHPSDISIDKTRTASVVTASTPSPRRVASVELAPSRRSGRDAPRAPPRRVRHPSRARVRCAPFRSFLSSSSRARSLKTRVDVCIGVGGGGGVSSRRLSRSIHAYSELQIAIMQKRRFASTRTSTRVIDAHSRHRRAFASRAPNRVGAGKARRRRARTALSA